MRFGNDLGSGGYNGCEMVEDVWGLSRRPDGGDEGLDGGNQVISAGFKESLGGNVSQPSTGNGGKREETPP